jgi:peroxiredoxin
MRTNRLLILVLILLVASCNSEQGYHIEGTINQDSGTMYLQTFRNKMFFIADSARIENGKFRFSGKVGRPDLFGLTTDREESFQPWFIFVENSRIRVNLDTADTRTAGISGSDAHLLYESYLAARSNFNIDSFIVAHPASTVPLYVLYRDFSTRLSADQLEASLSKADPSLSDLAYVTELREVIEAKKNLDIGSKAVDFTGLSPEGHAISLSDFAGKYVLIEFWAAWCGPCRRENPNLVKVYHKFHQDGFEILGVSLDNNREDWLKAIETDQLVWSHVSDLKFWDSEPAKLYGIRHIPSNVLVDREGTIVGKNLKSDQLSALLDISIH